MEDEEQGNRSHEVLRRLGATIVACEHCKRQYAVRKIQHWVSIFVDGEMFWDPPEAIGDMDATSLLCCSDDCALAATSEWNEKHGQQEPHLVEAVYTPLRDEYWEPAVALRDEYSRSGCGTFRPKK